MKLAAGPSGDTIFALASGPGRSAISVVRVSGDACQSLVTQLCKRLPQPRVASLRNLRNSQGDLLDRALVIWMPAPRSYSGEDSAELHLHGGRAVLAAVMQALVEFGGRPADAGEFSRRAVSNGKMDLLQAEAVADLVNAETVSQRTQALRQLDGKQGLMLADWAQRLRECMAWQEALIDFADEALPSEVDAQLSFAISDLLESVSSVMTATVKGTRLRDGLIFAITGPPNVGKSSLLNALAGAEAAIVSPHPGTTRDMVRVELTFCGIPVTLVDTAGIRETADVVEQEGIRRTLASLESADLIIGVEDNETAGSAVKHGHIRVMNKVDLGPAPAGVIGVSALTGTGLDELTIRLQEQAQALACPENTPAFNQARHSAVLRDMQTALLSAAKEHAPELRAEDLRIAANAVGRLTGAVDSEATLDLVFSRFCIGK